MNADCRCPVTKCKNHGDCAACQAYHDDPQKVLNFCKWAKLTGFNEPESRLGLRAWLSNNRAPFDISASHKRPL